MPDSVEAGLERFMADRGARLYRAARALTGDPHRAEDLLQTALVKSWGSYGSLANDHKFEAFLRTTMYRTYVSWWRRLSWRSEVVTGRGEEAVTEPDGSETWLDLRRALATLPPMQRAVLVLRFLEDRSIAEVAETLGVSAGSVKKYTHRGCQTLRGSIHLVEQEIKP